MPADAEAAPTTASAAEMGGAPRSGDVGEGAVPAGFAAREGTAGPAGVAGTGRGGTGGGR